MDNPRTPLLLRPFKWLWYLITAIYRTLAVMLMLLVIVGVWVISKHESPLVKIESGVALVLAPSGELVDQVDDDAFGGFLRDMSGEPPSKTLVRDIVEALETAAEDPRIPMAVLRMDDLTSAGMPQIEEISDAVKKFRAAGKPIYTWGTYYDQTQYLLAAQTDQISLDPYGILMLEGLSSYGFYFREALDKLGVSVNVFRVGEYKSAVEPFLRNDMSAEAKEANRQWLGDLWSNYGDTVADSRKLSKTAISEYVDGMSAGLVRTHGDASAYALESKLVDTVEKLDQFRARVSETVGVDDDIGSFRQLDFRDYLTATRSEYQVAKPQTDSVVALVTVQGEIVDGVGEPGFAGGDTVADLLSQVRRDDTVDAVLLRVDSPGGSVFASEQIRREVQALRADGKPVVVSMGSVAASGGYWISMDADEIWAHASTITGSIGIFGLLPTFEKPLAKLGVHTDGIGTTSLAGSLRGDRALTPEVSAILQSQIEHGYRQFIEGVAAGRKLKVEDVDKIARGHVWSGTAALGLGLVDKLGGLEEAANSAAKKAGLEEDQYELVEFKPETDFPWRRWAGFVGGAGSGSLQLLSAPLDQVSHLLRLFSDRRGVYAHCFCTPNLGGR